MHLPPSAQWRLGRSRAHGGLLVLMAAINSLLLVFLWGQVAPIAWWALLAQALALLLHALARWWKSPLGTLRWTGREWHWMQAQAVHGVQVCTLRWVLDWQTVALVHVRPEWGIGPSRWLWLERGGQSPAAWTALRRALLSSAISGGQETPRAQTAAFGGTTNFSSDHLTGPQAPHLLRRGASAAVGAGANGLQDSTLR